MRFRIPHYPFSLSVSPFPFPLPFPRCLFPWHLSIILHVLVVQRLVFMYTKFFVTLSSQAVLCFQMLGRPPSTDRRRTWKTSNVVAWENSLHSRDATTGFPAKWRAMAPGSVANQGRLFSPSIAGRAGVFCSANDLDIETVREFGRVRGVASQYRPVGPGLQIFGLISCDRL